MRALDNVSFACKKGEVHGLVGENGAGKSTLMKILSGVYTPDEGRILFKGRAVSISSPREAKNLGISTIYQEFTLIPHLTVAQNMLLGNEPRNALGWIDEAAIARRSREELSFLGVDLDTNIAAGRLGVSQQQVVEIAKAITSNVELLIMDEPSSAIDRDELNRLFDVMHTLKNRGVTMIYVSHHLDQILEICDRVTVLRDGKVIEVADVNTLTKQRLINLIVGKNFAETFPEKSKPNEQKEILKVVNLTRHGYFKNCCFSLFEGEILGLAGLMGSGRTELVRTIFGAETADEGEIYLDGKITTVDRPDRAIKHGIAYVAEDRKTDGIILGLSVRHNICLPSLDKRAKFGIIEEQKENNVVVNAVSEWNIRTPSINQEVQYLSGGNQQKIVVAKWLETKAKVIIFDEPTRGIDVNTKAEIYHVMRTLASRGIGIIMISSEVPEVVGMSDRILIMVDGEIKQELPPNSPEEEVMSACQC